MRRIDTGFVEHLAEPAMNCVKKDFLHLCDPIKFVINCIYSKGGKSYLLLSGTSDLLQTNVKLLDALSKSWLVVLIYFTLEIS